MARFWRLTGICAGTFLLCSAQLLAQEGGTDQSAAEEQQAKASLPSYYDVPGDVHLASLMQQPAAAPGLATSQPPSRPTPSSRQGNIRLASVPNMFGDLGLTTCISVDDFGGPLGTQFVRGMADIPLAGGARTGKLAENDVALPVDRVFATYNHYNNILKLTEEDLINPGTTLVSKQPIDRYTIGFEKTFMDGWGSVEVRMPFSGNFDQTLNLTSVNGGSVGNLSVILKSLLYRDEALGIGLGVAIDSPTGSDVATEIGDAVIRIDNDAVHILPYLGFLYSAGDPQFGWGEGLFMSGFVQVDVAANGNNVAFGEGGQPLTNVGLLNEQTLMFFDLAVGYWLYRNPDAPRVTGLAAIVEAHYTTTVQDADLLIGNDPSANLVIGNTDNRFDVVNGTVGVQMLLFDASSLRVAGVFPMGSRDDQRFFDSELQVQFNRRF